MILTEAISIPKKSTRSASRNRREWRVDREPKKPSGLKLPVRPKLLSLPLEIASSPSLSGKGWVHVNLCSPAGSFSVER